MMDVGRLCVKIAGRDAGKKAVIIKKLDDRNVIIDGETRRKKCNIAHLEPLKQRLDVPEDASHDEVKNVFITLGIALKDKVKKERKKGSKEGAMKKVTTG